MRKTIWNKRIPTLLGLIILVIGIGVTSFLVRNNIPFFSQASIGENPQNVKITNITDTSFTVSYITSDSVAGIVSYGITPTLGQTALDDRDQLTGSVASYNVHHVTVRNLKASTKYYFSITSGQSIFLNNNEPFEITTGITIQTPPTNQPPMTGTILGLDGAPAKNTIIYVSTGESQTLSILLKQDGTYLLPLNALRTQDLTQYFVFSETTVIELLAQSPSEQSTATLFASQIKPVPTITLSKNYDFRNGETTNAEIATPSAGFSLLQSLPITPLEKKVQITTPKNNESFQDARPIFKGTTAPNTTVEITIHSDENIKTQVISDTAGNWTFRPLTVLSPGNHTITIVSRDASGVIKSITHSFVINASGTQVAQSATPSGTLTPSTSPTKSPTPTPTTSGTTLTPTPASSTTLTISPTLALSPTTITTPTQIAAITQPPTPLPRKTLPPAGSSDVIIGGIAATVIMTLGAILFFF